MGNVMIVTGTVLACCSIGLVWAICLFITAKSITDQRLLPKLKTRTINDITDKEVVSIFLSVFNEWEGTKVIVERNCSCLHYHRMLAKRGSLRYELRYWYETHDIDIYYIEYLVPLTSRTVFFPSWKIYRKLEELGFFVADHSEYRKTLKRDQLFLKNIKYQSDELE